MKKLYECWGIVWRTCPPAWQFAPGQGSMIVRETVDKNYRTIIELFSYVVLPQGG